MTCHDQNIMVTCHYNVMSCYMSCHVSCHSPTIIFCSSVLLFFCFLRGSLHWCIVYLNYVIFYSKVGLFSFMAFILISSDNILDANKAFVSLSIFNILSNCLIIDNPMASV